MELSAFGVGNSKHGLSHEEFASYFTSDKPVIFNFHGYPEALEPMLLHQKNPNRFSVHGYIENGSTTTPFDMQVRNKTSRYHLVLEALRLMSERGVVLKNKADDIIAKYEKKLSDHCVYIKEHGVDPDEIELWQWKRNT